MWKEVKNETIKPIHEAIQSSEGGFMAARMRKISLGTAFGGRGT